MASSNRTPNYNLPQYAENDTIEITPEINNAFSTIDTAIKTNATNIGSLAGAPKFLGDVSWQNANNLPTGFGMVNSETATNYGYPLYYGVILSLNAGTYRSQSFWSVSGPSQLRTRSSNNGGASWSDWANNNALQNLNDQVTPLSGIPNGSALTKSLRTYILNVDISTMFTGGSWKVLANIAPGHRPLFTVHTAVLSGSGNVGWLQVADNGSISAFFKEDAIQVVGQILWIA